MKGDLSSDGGLVWTHLSDASPEELAEFVRDSGLEVTDAEFVVHNHHRPEVAVRAEYVIILIHVPTFNKQTRVTRGVPLYLVIRENHLWTIHQEPIVVLDGVWADFSTNQEKRSEYFSDGSASVALHIVSELYSTAFNKLARLSNHIDIAEDAVFQGNERKMVEEISLLMRDVMDFRKIVRLQTNLFATLPNHPLLTATCIPLWSRVHGQTKKLWDVLEGLYESTTQLGLTNRDLLQHKENALLRLLTVYSIFSIPALILISPYNRPSPYDNVWDAALYLGIFGAFVVGLFVILYRARRRRIL